MRRLPVYLLIDVSGSMSGEPIENVKLGIRKMISSLRKDPQALETVCISIITFSNYATQVVPLVDLPNFQMAEFDASGGTELGEALILLANKANIEVAKTTAELKGDWKPLVFVLTDGDSYDISKGVEAFKKHKWGFVLACAIGNEVSTDKLKVLTESTVRIDTTNPDAIKIFFEWVSSSIIASSKCAGTCSDVSSIDQLPPLPREINICKSDNIRENELFSLNQLPPPPPEMSIF